MTKSMRREESVGMWYKTCMCVRDRSLQQRREGEGRETAGDMTGLLYYGIGRGRGGGGGRGISETVIK